MTFVLAASGLEWARGGLWPVLLLVPIAGLLLGWAFAAVRAGRRRYGAPLRERPLRPAGRALLWSAAALLLWLTWMEPQLGEEKIRVERRGVDLVFALDTSRSMLARDLEPDRLTRAKRDIESVLPLLVGGDRVALVAFAGRAKLVVPLTHDLDAFRWLLERVDTDAVHLGGTNLGAAIEGSLQLIDEEHEKTAAVVLLTDGEDLEGRGLEAVAKAADRGIVVHAVGYGSPRGSKILLEDGGEESFLRGPSGDEVVSTLDVEALRKIAQATGGEMVRADAMPLPVRELYEKRIQPMLQRAYDAGEERQAKTRFQWTLLPVVLLLLVELAMVGGRR